MIEFALGWSCGAAMLWIYFRFWSGLHRTRAEFELVQKIGPDWMDEYVREHPALGDSY